MSRMLLRREENRAILSIHHDPSGDCFCCYCGGAITPPLDEAETLNKLDKKLYALKTRLASSLASSLGLSGSRAVLFDHARTGNLNYIRTVEAAVQMTREAPDLLNSYHAAVALTGLEYDLKGLLLAAEMTGAATTKRWSSDIRTIADEVNTLGLKAYSRFELRMIHADLALKQVSNPNFAADAARFAPELRFLLGSRLVGCCDAPSCPPTGWQAPSRPALSAAPYRKDAVFLMFTCLPGDQQFTLTGRHSSGILVAPKPTSFESDLRQVGQPQGG